MAQTRQLDHSDILLIIDVQNDFCTGGALAVSDGEAVVPVINALSEVFHHTALSQDWHPDGHMSFASSHPGSSPFDTIEASYGPQTLWPDHCVQGTNGAEFVDGLNTDHAEFVVRKGFRRGIDSYSAFFENDKTTVTGLQGYLTARGFNRVHLCGLATDYCVAYSAIDAMQCGFEAVVIEDACRAIDLDGSLDQARNQMRNAGVSFSQASDYK